MTGHDLVCSIVEGVHAVTLPWGVIGDDLDARGLAVAHPPSKRCGGLLHSRPLRHRLLSFLTTQEAARMLL
jgi:hypothetical protein